MRETDGIAVEPSTPPGLCHPKAPYTLQKLKPRHYKVLLLHLAGRSLREIARLVGMSESMIGYVTRSAVYRAEMHRLRRELESRFLDREGTVREQLGALAGRSVEELEAILDDEEAPARVRAQVAMNILDRGGFGAPERREVAVDFASAAIAAFRRRQALEAARQAQVDPGATPDRGVAADGLPGVPGGSPRTLA